MEEAMRRCLEALEKRRRNARAIIIWAALNAEAVRRLGKRWFEIRDRWLQEAWRRDQELLRDPKIREAIIKAYQAMDKWAAKYKDGLHPPGD